MSEPSAAAVRATVERGGHEPSDDQRFAARFVRQDNEAASRDLVRCRRCGYVTLAVPLDESETWHYARTGQSRFGGCPLHPWGWHFWNTDAKPPPVYRVSAQEREALTPNKGKAA